MFELQLVVLGILQGITEFLPISSSAHLILVSDLFNWKDQGINHDIAVHIGTLGAVLFYLRNSVISILSDIKLFFIHQRSAQEFLFVKIVISTLPSIVVGFVVYNYFMKYFRDIHLIAYSCIFFGIILYLADKYSVSKKTWEKLSFSDAFIIGICQCFAFIPGASRAGVTITGSRLLGLSRESAAIYSLLLSIPIIIASLFLAFPNFFNDSENIFNLKQVFTSSIVSFITAFFSIKFLMGLVKKYSYNSFVIYRILLGIIILAYIYI